MPKKNNKWITSFGVLSILLTFPLSSPAAAGFADAGVNARTHLLLKEDAGGHNYAAAYEYIDLEMGNIMAGRLSFHLSGWFRHHFDEVPKIQGKEVGRDEEELTYAYLNYSPFRNGSLQFRIGRQLIFDGPASEYVDGITAQWDITDLNGVSVYGGVPVDNADDDRCSDSIVGGRIYQRIRSDAEIGFSYLAERDNHSLYREEAGTDLWFQLMNMVEVQGWSLYNNRTDDWMDNDYTIRIFPFDTIIFSASYSHTTYQDFFSSDALSAFSPDFLGEDEELDKINGSLEYEYHENLTLAFDYAVYHYKEAGSAGSYGIRLTGDILSGISAGASLHRMDGDTERLRYTGSRIYVTKNFRKAGLSFDSMYLYYDKAFAGRRYAYSLNGNLSYRLGKAVTAAANVEYLKDYDFTDSVVSFLTLEYAFH